jgi:hypothetical protein
MKGRKLNEGFLVSPDIRQDMKSKLKELASDFDEGMQ